MEAIIDLQHIDFKFPHSDKGLNDISLSIPNKQKTVVLGLNGAGKSTLFLMLCGILKPKVGRYLIEGKLFKFTKKECREIGQHIGYVFQDPETQLFAPTVYDDIAFGLRNKGISEEIIKTKVEEYLTFLNIEELKYRLPHELSYGQKKLVAIAGVLVMKPKVLILDEPFAWLDNIQQQNMIKLLDTLYKQNITIVLSTHNLDFAFSWADYGIVIKEGCCVQQGDITLLKQQPLMW